MISRIESLWLRRAVLIAVAPLAFLAATVVGGTVGACREIGEQFDAFAELWRR